MIGRAPAPSGVLAAAGLVAVGCGLALGGCAPAPVPRPTPTASTTASAAADGFPGGVPLLPGRVLAHDHADGEWHVWIAAADPLQGYRRAQALLLGSGFVITKDRQGTGGADGQLCTERLCVGLTGVDDPFYGPSVAYEVFRPTGTS